MPKLPQRKILVVIPTCRSAPIKTLVEHKTRYPTVVLVDRKADRNQIREWVNDTWDGSKNKPQVIWGKEGPGPQSAECYRVAYKMGFKYFFRFDDDIQEKFFINKDKEVVSLDTAIGFAYKAAQELGTSLTGFSNTSRTDWLGNGFGVTYGQVHGGSQLGLAMKDPSPVVDESLPAYVDIWRTLAHRQRDGAVGRVKFIGLDRTESLRNSSILKSPKLVEECKERILSEFPDLISCKGERVLDGGKQVIPNWRMKPDQGYYQKRKEIQCGT